MLARLLSALSLAAVRSEFAAVTARFKLRAALLGALAVLWLLALVFFIIALTAWLSTLIGPIAACAILAAVFAVLAIGVHVALFMIKRRKRTSLASALSQAIAPLTAAMGEAKAEGVEAAETSETQGAAGQGTEAASTGILLALAGIGYALGRSVTRR